MRYKLRRLDLRSELYKHATEEPTYEKIFMSILYHVSDVDASDDLSEPL